MRQSRDKQILTRKLSRENKINDARICVCLAKKLLPVGGWGGLRKNVSHLGSWKAVGLSWGVENSRTV